ncbi:MAG: family 10 glycosylhydrolase [Firmicutes bacterium]|nr:family 10 glycosylhydrolase [Bacillota bacterium]
MKLRSLTGCLAAVLALFLALPALAAPSRGLWVVRYNLESPQEIDAVVDAAQAGSIKDIYAQVCGRAEAYYRSQLLPSAPGIEQGFDPLGYLLERAQSKGIKVHAWVNAYTVASWSRLPDLSPQHILNRHPEWVQVDSLGRSLWEYSGPTSEVPALFLDPGALGVREHVVSVVKEIVENYPVDGIHLDYIRYPGPEYGYTPSSLSAFAAEKGWQPLSDGLVDPLEWDNWRRRQVTETVAAVKEVVALHSGVQLSAAVVSDPLEARSEYLQDWQEWLAKGLVDYVVPMVYLDDLAEFARALDNIRHWVGTEGIAPGIGVYKIADQPRVLARQMQLVEELGFSRLVFFEYQTMAEHAVFSQLQLGLPSGF